MKIYFAGSICGGRGDKALYAELIACLERFGRVLTEHVGNQDLSHMGEQDLTDDEIYRQDMGWLEESDAVVAEVTTPSLGVGYEIGRAETAGKPVLCLYRPGSDRRLSAMLAGCPNLKIAQYEKIPEATAHIEDFFNAL